MGDSGTWASPKDMANWTALRKRSAAAEKLTGIAKARSVGGKALAKGMPAVKPPQADTLHSKIAEAGEINQGLFKGQRGLSVRRTSDGYMRKK